MNKFAAMICTNGAYITGVNATLTVMEMYNLHEKVDIYILLWPDGFIPNNEQFIEWRKQYPYVNFVEFDGSWTNYPGDYFFHLCHYPYHFALKNLFPKYDVVLHWGGDVCLVSDIYDYFIISQSLNKIIMGENELSYPTFKNMTKEWPYNHTWDIPYVDAPFFIPSTHADLLEYQLEMQYKPGHGLASMDGLVYAIRDLNKPVFAVPGKLWILTSMYPGLIDYSFEDNKIIVRYDKMLMHSFHGRYWGIGWCNNYIKKGSDTYIHNAKAFNTIYAVLNSNYRVKWPLFETWGGYPNE